MKTITPRPTAAPPKGGQPTAEDLATIEALKLNGIVYNKKRPKALVNNQIVTAGDMVGRVKIVEIQKNFIKVELNGKTHDVYY